MIPAGMNIGRTGSGTTWNPADKGGSAVLSGANLTAGASANNNDSSVRSTTSKSTGKWHYEITVNAINSGTSRPQFGIATSSYSVSTALSNAQTIIVLSENLARVSNQAMIGLPLVDNIIAGSIVAVELDADTEEVSFQVQGGTRQTYSVTPLTAPFFAVTNNAIDTTCTVNFGTTPFAVPMTAGYAPWNQT